MSSRTNFAACRSVLVCLVVLVGAASIAPGGHGWTPGADFFYVDGIHGNDRNNGFMPGTAFATIQKAIDTAQDGGIVLVYPGLYRGEVNFQGKALVVQGVVSGTAGIPVLQNPGDFAVSFYGGEGPESVLSNFVIRGSFMAVFIAGSSPTLSHLTVVDNTYGIEAYAGSQPDISNSIFWRNTGSDLFGSRARFSRTSVAAPGEGNITAAPLLVDPNSGDYHLLSARGRYWPEHDVWVLDRVTSPCIDGGDPTADPSDEPIPNGARVNMGAYGGTAQASMSPQPLPSRAFNPSPPDGAVGVDLSAILSWEPGINSVLHDVHFGTQSPPPLVSSQAVTQFDPGGMDSDTVYYWSIYEVDSEGNRTAGPIWQFTTTPVRPPKGRACFVPETGVWVDGALVSISKVAPGRHIGITAWATSCPSYMQPWPCRGRVRQVQEHAGVFQCCDVLLESGNTITVAERHYFMTESGHWVAVQDLKADTRLRTATGSIGIVNVTARSQPYVGKVYNLKIEGSDRYLVGKDAVVVRDH